MLKQVFSSNWQFLKRVSYETMTKKRVKVIDENGRVSYKLVSKPGKGYLLRRTKKRFPKQHKYHKEKEAKRITKEQVRTFHLV